MVMDVTVAKRLLSWSRCHGLVKAVTAIRLAQHYWCGGACEVRLYPIVEDLSRDLRLGTRNFMCKIVDEVVAKFASLKITAGPHLLGCQGMRDRGDDSGASIHSLC